MKDMFSIGELAGYQNISKQTLIFYDKIGLFQPAYVDPSNKYRYYTAKQIDYLDTILIMKAMGFSLGEIQEHMKNYTIDVNFSNLYVNFLTYRKDVVYIIYSLIGNLRNMNQTVNAFNNLSKCTERRYRNYSCLNNIAYIIIILEFNPRVVLSLFKAKRNSS